MPDPDIIIRTGGEKRLSGFLLWQSAYSELFFIDKHWPDFSKEDLEAVLAEYAARERRMGK
jgi:undecaprenyl diphosphate synthase